MIEKVNPSHPDKICDRIAGAIVDLAYAKEHDPKVAAEVLLGHKTCTIIVETTAAINANDIADIVDRIGGPGIRQNVIIVPQDAHLAQNQEGKVRCGDNGIFKGVPLTAEERDLSSIARAIYERVPYDGKYILDGKRLIICQSNTDAGFKCGDYETITNPLGPWEGGPDVDTGAVNRKLGSDMAQSVTGGGLHGKDLSKADVSVNIWAFCKAQVENKPVELSCAIGDEEVGGVPYSEIVDFARNYIRKAGGFEKFAEWGLF